MTDTQTVTNRLARSQGSDFMESRAALRRSATGGFDDYLNQAAGQAEPPARAHEPALDKVSRQAGAAAKPKDKSIEENNSPAGETLPVAPAPQQTPEQNAPVAADGETADPGLEPEGDGGLTVSMVTAEPSVQKQDGFSVAVAAAFQITVEGAEETVPAALADDTPPPAKLPTPLPVMAGKPAVVPVQSQAANTAVTGPEPAVPAPLVTGASGAPSANPLTQPDTVSQEAGQEQGSPKEPSSHAGDRLAGQLAAVDPEPASGTKAVPNEDKAAGDKPVEKLTGKHLDQAAEEQRQDVVARQQQLAQERQVNRAVDNQPQSVVPPVVTAPQANAATLAIDPEKRSISQDTDGVTAVGLKHGGGESTPVQKMLAVEKSAEKPVDMADNVDEIVKSVRTLIQRNQSVVQLRLDPPELGALRIEMKMDAGGLNLQLQTGSLRTQQLLQQNNHELRAALEASGFQTGQIDIQLRLDLKNGDSPAQQNPNQHHGQSAGGGQQHGGAFQQEFHAHQQQEFGAGGFEEGFWQEEPAMVDGQQPVTIPATAALSGSSGGRGFLEWQFTRLDVTI